MVIFKSFTKNKNNIKIKFYKIIKDIKQDIINKI